MLGHVRHERDLRMVVTEIGQLHRAKVRVLDGPAVAVDQRDGHAQRHVVALPGDEQHRHGPQTGGVLLNRLREGSRCPRRDEFDDMADHGQLDAWLVLRFPGVPARAPRQTCFGWSDQWPVVCHPPQNVSRNYTSWPRGHDVRSGLALLGMRRVGRRASRKRRRTPCYTLIVVRPAINRLRSPLVSCQEVTLSWTS